MESWSCKTPTTGPAPLLVAASVCTEEGWRQGSCGFAGAVAAAAAAVLLNTRTPDGEEGKGSGPVCPGSDTSDGGRNGGRTDHPTAEPQLELVAPPVGVSGCGRDGAGPKETLPDLADLARTCIDALPVRKLTMGDPVTLIAGLRKRVAPLDADRGWAAVRGAVWAVMPGRAAALAPSKLASSAHSECLLAADNPLTMPDPRAPSASLNAEKRLAKGW